MHTMPIHRKDHEPPPAIASWGWQYHHTGIPVKTAMPGETYLPGFKMHVSGFDTSPFGIEWMRFDADCPLPGIIQTLPHVAFQVDDLDLILQNTDFEILLSPAVPSEGVMSAMLLHNGAPIELISFHHGGGPR